MEKHFSERDWLSAMRSFRSKKDHISLSAILDMHFYTYEGNISFLEKDIQNILQYENLSLKNLSDKYGYPFKYLKEPEIQSLFWQKLKNSLQRNPEALVKVLSIYEEEKTHRSQTQWASLLESYFVEKDWLNLMQSLRNKKNRMNLSKVLDMHYEIYEGKIPFLNSDLYAILQNRNPPLVSLAEITDIYGYKALYVNAPEVRREFWQDVSDSIEETESLNWPFTFQRGAKSCSYLYIKDLFLFFSESQKEGGAIGFLSL